MRERQRVVEKARVPTAADIAVVDHHRRLVHGDKGQAILPCLKERGRQGELPALDRARGIELILNGAQFEHGVGIEIEAATVPVDLEFQRRHARLPEQQAQVQVEHPLRLRRREIEHQSEPIGPPAEGPVS